MIDYAGLRKEQLEKRARGELMGIGISSFTEVVGAGPSRDYDILGIKMFDSAEIRIHPTGKAIARFGTKSQGQAHETTYAQIIAEELGLPATDIQVEEGDTDTAPYGLGTYASRCTPTAGAAAVMAARKIKAKAARSRPICLRSARTIWSGMSTAGRSRARPTRPRPSRRSPLRPIPTIRWGWRPGWRRPTTTTRQT